MDKSPLKLSVNLYSASLLPKKLRLSFFRLTLVVIILPCIAALYSAMSFMTQQKLEAQLNTATLQQQHLMNEQDALKQRLELHKPAADLVYQLAKTKTKLELTRQLSFKVSNTEQHQSQSYQALLEDLAQTADGSIWLTNIDVDGQHINLTGETQKAAAVPAWIKRLSGTESLADVSFNQLLINREQNNVLHFRINSQIQTEQELSGEGVK